MLTRSIPLRPSRLAIARTVIAPSHLFGVAHPRLPALARYNTANAPPTQARFTMPSGFQLPHSPRSSEKRKILVLGAGNFGCCLADHLGDSEHEVYLW